MLVIRETFKQGKTKSSFYKIKIIKNINVNIFYCECNMKNKNQINYKINTVIKTNSQNRNEIISAFNKKMLKLISNLDDDSYKFK